MFDFSSLTFEIAALFIATALAVLQLLEFIFTRNAPWLLRLMRGLWRSIKRRFRPAKYRTRKILLNLSGHPLKSYAHRAEAACKTLGWRANDVDILDVPIPTISENQDFLKQATRILERADLSEEEWQTVPMAVVLPGYAPLCAVLMAELHGRMGFFPQMARFRQQDGVWVLVDDVINLQAVRTENRSKRYQTGARVLSVPPPGAAPRLDAMPTSAPVETDPSSGSTASSPDTPG